MRSFDIYRLQDLYSYDEWDHLRRNRFHEQFRWDRIVTRQPKPEYL
jgi:hypothetical protein